jgi:hypothetical protein
MAALGLSLVCTGCTPTEDELIISLESALNSLEQNKGLTEQFVRDVKTGVSPSDPAYAELMDSYENAREAYDHYLDEIEIPSRATETRSLHHSSRSEVQNATADFLADATSALKPDVKTRRIPFQRAVVIPDDLQHNLQKLPKKTRQKLIDRFDEQLRWRSWSQL